MEYQEYSAHEAPPGSHAKVPTGFRRMTPGLLKADRSAEKFNGLPEGIEAPGQLLATFKAAAPRLGISSRLVHAVDYLFCHTRPQDWAAGSRPIVWPSNDILQTTFGISERQVQDVTRRLIELGLVTMKDSPNGKRYGHRDPQGRIIEAYGFDLSLFAVRHAEFVQLAAELDAERRTMRKLRRRRTIAHKAIIQILETAREYNFVGEEWDILEREAKELYHALKTIETPDDMEAGVTSLERRWQAARERIEGLLRTVETAPKDAENRTHIYNYNPTLNLNKDTVTAANTCKAEDGASPPQPSPKGLPERPERGRISGVAPYELPRLAPRLNRYLRGSDPTWPELVDAAGDWLRHDLGISKALWGDACLRMGRELATVALAVVSTKDPAHFKSSPGGYFHGMVAKHIAGELRLDRTIWALRRANDPDGNTGQRYQHREGYNA
jgi:replication initiation protein RepC